MAYITLAKGSLVILGGVTLSEQGRSPFEVSFDEVKYDARTVTGTMRRYYVASKARYTVSWDMLPAVDSYTFDNKAGRNTLRGLHDSNMGVAVTLQYYEVNSSNVQTYITKNVFIDNYVDSLVKRWDTQFWNVSMTLVEV